MEQGRAQRRNPNEGVGESTVKSTKRPHGERTANDEEIDEFFAILKRLQEVKRLKINNRSSSDDMKRCRATWQPVFTLDDFKEITNGPGWRNRNRTNEQEEVVSRSFDLNAEPEVETSTNC